MLGLVILRGAHIVSCSVDGPPPADPATRLGAGAQSGAAPTALQSGPGISKPAGRGAGAGLQGPAAGVGGPGFPSGGFAPAGFPAGRGAPPSGFPQRGAFPPGGGAPPGMSHVTPLLDRQANESQGVTNNKASRLRPADVVHSHRQGFPADEDRSTQFQTLRCHQLTGASIGILMTTRYSMAGEAWFVGHTGNWQRRRSKLQVGQSAHGSKSNAGPEVYIEKM
jgi:hypothetical protein